MHSIYKLFTINLSIYFWGMCVVTTGFAQTTDPILRLNTEMHTARITDIDIDAHGELLITGSEDKTARLWRARTGEPLRVLRPPIDADEEGQIRAVAISPNGEYAAISGWTGRTWDDSYSIYVFDTQTGSLHHRISGFQEMVLSLKYSPDGNYLAAGLSGKGGVIIYHHEDGNYRKFHTLEGYGDNVYELGFTLTGNYFGTVSFDGSVRLYNSQFQLISQNQNLAGKEVFGLSFSPTGRSLVVGFNDTPEFQVLSIPALEELYRPSIHGVTSPQAFIRFSFSNDGETLFAGRSIARELNDMYLVHIRKYENAGRGEFIDIPVAHNIIRGMVTSSDGDILLAGAQPDIGRITPNGTLQYYKRSPLPDYRLSDKTHFKVNENGKQIGFTPVGGNPKLIDVTNRTLEKESARFPHYTARNSNIRITNWEGSTVPQFNGNVVSFLDDRERVLSVDIARDGSMVAIGADWHLYGLDPSGRKLWQTPAQSATAVKFSGDSQIISVATGDGLIRWHRAIDGELLLSLFIDREGYWILYTPSGYYDAAPGAENQLGWHLNQGSEREARFYPVSRFRSMFNRPDVIDAIFEVHDEQNAIALANQRRGIETVDVMLTDRLPPVIQILSPHSGAQFVGDEVTLRYTVDSDSEIIAIRALVDGRPVSRKRGFVMVEEGETITIEVPSRNTRVSLIAENKHGSSEPATIDLFWNGEVEEKEEILPELFILAVGVSAYLEESLILDYAAKDAKDFVQAWEKKSIGMYRNVEARILTDGDATRQQIIEGLNWLTKRQTKDDLAIIFFAGHGHNDSDGQFYYLPVEAELGQLKSTGLPQYKITNTLHTLTGYRLMFMDACHSGNVMQSISSQRNTVEINSVINEMASAEYGAITFSSSTGRQFSYEHPDWANGAFTRAFLEGLAGGADFRGSGRITIKMLDLYISERVSEITNGRQTPTTVYPPNVPDFPIVLIQQ